MNGSLFYTLTINPSDAHSLKNGHKEQTHPAGRIVVKELEDVHAPLSGERYFQKHKVARRDLLRQET